MGKTFAKIRILTTRNVVYALRSVRQCEWNRIKTLHGSFSQEKALVTGFEAANATIDYLELGKQYHRKIVPVEEDEAHIVAARRIYRIGEQVRNVLNPGSVFFMR